VRLILAEDYEELCRIGADYLAGVVAAKPDAAVVFPTGETPMGIYREMAARCQRGELNATRLRVFQLDEYLEISPEDHRSLYRWMERALIGPLGIPVTNVVRLPTGSSDPVSACRAYDEAVRAEGGFDLAVLGLGPNGHLGFNEPPSEPDSTTRVVELTEESVDSNARYWGSRDQVPRRAMTAGMDVLLAARHTLLVVSGEHKRGILHRALEGPVAPEVPASYLRLAPDVTVLADSAAWGPNSSAGKLSAWDTTS
jgi:glucosamine-6-phosphate deaminase